MKQYTVYEVSEAFHVGPETVRRWIRSGELKTIIMCKKTGHVINEDELEKFVENHPKYRARMLMGVAMPAIIYGYKQTRAKLKAERDRLLQERNDLDKRIHEIEELLREG